VERLRYDEDKAFFLADDASTIARIVRTVPADRLRATKFDEWTAVEIIGHVADAAEIFADRVQRCIDEDRPTVAAYDQDAVAAERRTTSAIRWSSRGGSPPRTRASSSFCSGPAPLPVRAGTATGATSTPDTSRLTRPIIRTPIQASWQRLFRLPSRRRLPGTQLLVMA